MTQKKHSTTYKDSGVDISKGNLFIKQIKPLVKSTHTKDVLTNIGSFSGLYSLAANRYKEPVLVSSADGVGTKLLIAQMAGLHRSIGFDLVGMCVNDIATTCANPLFFLDYISTGKLNRSTLKKVISGISSACLESGYALIGGETAEMPDMYKPDEYDLAGFCVGIAEKKDIIDGKTTKRGDIVLGLASNGLHSNGYSLVRKVLRKKDIIKFKKELLKPTRLYTKPLLNLAQTVRVKGIAHITGGAYEDKLSRIIPVGLSAQIKKESWEMPKIFQLIKAAGNISDKEMYRVFNMGIGMALVISPESLKKARSALKRHNIESWQIGTITKGNRKVELI